jgi:hypothetical protein
MKKLLLAPLPVLVGLMLWGGTGCSNHEVDTVKLKSAFQSADPDVRTEVDKGIADITAGNYSEALTLFKHVGHTPKLTKEQNLIVLDSVKKLQTKVK